jgi:uncharacterized protein DUF397
MDQFQEQGHGAALPPLETFGWRKSSWSYHEANCVEVAIARAGGHVFVRDSKAVADGGLYHLKFSATAWEPFIKSIKDGRMG